MKLKKKIYIYIYRKKISAIITDIPYNVSRDNNFKTLGKGRQGIDFGEWDYNFDYLSWVSKYCELLSDNGSVIIFCGYKQLSFLIKELEKCGLSYKRTIIWSKLNPFPKNRERGYVCDVEVAVWAAKGKWVFNRDKTMPYERTIMSFPTLLSNERTIHPTQKPLALMEKLVRIHTNENDIVLDPFAGSGSTLVACLNLKRHCLGFEKDKKYCEIAQKRLLDAKREVKLF